MKSKFIFFVLFFFCANHVFAQNKNLTLGLFVSNLQIHLESNYSKDKAGFSNPNKPSIIGLSGIHEIKGNQIKHGIAFQVYAGNYWYFQNLSSTRPQGTLNSYTERRCTVYGIGFGYNLNWRLSEFRTKRGEKPFYGFNKLSILAQSMFDAYRINAPEVTTPYPGLNELNLKKVESSFLLIRQMMALQLTNSLTKRPYSIFAGPEYVLDMYTTHGRLGYRFGISISVIALKT